MIQNNTDIFKLDDIKNIGDPYVLKVDGIYYMYATSEPDIGFLVWKSTDLINWKKIGLAYNHLDQDVKWAVGDFWAPEVVYNKNMYYMVYSARNQEDSLITSIATSENPEGPFKDQTINVIKQKGSFIDGHIFIDDDGKAYLYYVKDNYENIVNGNKVSHIYVQEMTQDLLDLKGSSILLLKPDQEWEDPIADIQWNEGPFIVKKDDLYYLMYSANYFASEHYAIGYAVSSSPLGPFKKYQNNPILSSDLERGFSGPGHNSITTGLDGETLQIVYHIHSNPEKPSGDRKPAISQLYIEDKVMKVIED